MTPRYHPGSTDSQWLCNRTQRDAITSPPQITAGESGDNYYGKPDSLFGSGGMFSRITDVPSTNRTFAGREHLRTLLRHSQKYTIVLQNCELLNISNSSPVVILLQILYHIFIRFLVGPNTDSIQIPFSNIGRSGSVGHRHLRRCFPLSSGGTMRPGFSYETTLLECEVAAKDLIQRFDIRLVAEADMAVQATARLVKGEATTTHQAVMNVYCLALYRACSGEEGTLRQNQGYKELHFFLFSVACRRRRDLSYERLEDATQQAIERVFRSIQRCNKPLAFLAFANQQLLDTIRIERRQQNQTIDSLEQTLGDQYDWIDRQIASTTPTPEEHIVFQERHQTLVQFFDDLMRAKPRAATQIEILRLQIVEGLDNIQISQRMHQSLASIYTARSRIIETIRKESIWWMRAQQLGILDE